MTPEAEAYVRARVTAKKRLQPSQGRALLIELMLVRELLEQVRVEAWAHLGALTDEERARTGPALADVLVRAVRR